MTASNAIFLGIVQGLTEFLPISSSGHLILARTFFHLSSENGLAFDALLQLGTICSVLLYFSKKILQLCGEGWLLITRRGGQIPNSDKTLIFAIIIGTIPAMIGGLLLEKKMETTFRSPLLIAITLILGSLLLLIAERWHQQSNPLTIKRGFWIGCFQTLALLPGVSRSGSTISGGLLMGLDRETAVLFSFLLSIPIIAGSGLKKTIELLHASIPGLDLSILAIGFVTSFVIGLGAIHFLVTYLKRHSLSIFIFYRIGLALLVFLFL
jgi:undecaprenyl-diphosphatase